LFLWILKTGAKQNCQVVRYGFRFIKYIYSQPLWPYYITLNEYVIMSQLINASIDLTLILEMAHKGHSAFNVGKNGKTYCNVQIWINEEADKFGDHASIQLNSAKDMGDKDQSLHPLNPKDGKPGKRCYVGRGKATDLSPKPLDAGGAAGLQLPTHLQGVQGNTTQPAATGWQAPQTGNPGGLPF
jgi:hypothetical protein